MSSISVVVNQLGQTSISEYVHHVYKFLANFIAVPILLILGALLHPYYESDPRCRKIRPWLALATILLVLYSHPTRLFYPLEDFLHINYCVVSIPSFHVICLALQYACHRGPVLITQEIETNKHKKDDDGDDKGSADMSSSESYSDSSNNSCCSSTITNSDSCQQSQSGLATTARKLVGKNEKKEEEEKMLKLKNRFKNKNQHQQVLQQSDENLKNKKKNKKNKIKSPPPPRLGELARFSIWMTSSPRSLGYVWGPPESVLAAAPKRPMSEFITREIGKLIGHQLVLIVVSGLAIPVTAHRENFFGWINEHFGPGVLPDKPIVRWMCMKVPICLWGIIAMHAFSLVGSLFLFWELSAISLARLVLPYNSSWRPLPFDTTQYPGLFSRPILRTSLTDFWAKGWQAVFRRDFIFMGAEPMAKLFAPCGLVISRLAGLMGAMFISGVLHEWGMITSAKRIDWSFRTTKFFMMCGIGIVLEMVFKKLTGRRVQGPLGWIWLWTWFQFWCQDFLDAWFELGIGLSGMKGPYEISQWPLAKFLVPLGPLLPDQLVSWFSFS